MFNGNAIPRGDCLWLNNKLVPRDSICDAVMATRAPVVIALNSQSVAFNGITVPIPGQAAAERQSKSRFTYEVTLFHTTIRFV